MRTVKTPFGRQRPSLDVTVGVASWYAFSTMSLCALVAAGALARGDWLLSDLQRPGDQSALISLPAADAAQSRVASAVAEPADFVSTLPSNPDPDAIIRFISRLALDQGVRVSQVQSETTAPGARRLGQAKCTLQLRGDYRNIKNVTIGLLAKFPGLTLQRLVIHHRDAPSGGPADQGSDEASLELVQFLRPAATS